MPDGSGQGSPLQQVVFSPPCSQRSLPYMSYKCPEELQATGPNARICTEVMCKPAPGPSLMLSKSRLESNASASTWGPPSGSASSGRWVCCVFFKAFFALFLIYSKSRETFSCCFKAQSWHRGPMQKTNQQDSPKFHRDAGAQPHR